MTSSKPIYYDTETTGIKAQTDRIIEIAAYDPVDDRRFEMFVNPGIPIPEEASAVHGITDEMVQEAPSFKEVGQAFIDFCAGNTVLIAHNNDNFDKHFLRCEIERHGLDHPDWKMVDSLKWARKYRPDLPKHSLQYLRQVYSVEANQAHRAMDDVIVLWKVFSYLIDDLTIDTVLELMEESGDTMPFGKHAGKPLKDVPKNYISWLLKEGALDKPENANLKEAFEKLGLVNA
ncbi:MAG: DUF3820 family protein [Chlamydiales bacterium]|nr:DUF3820 family protein [Chlamydiales bacterium]